MGGIGFGLCWEQNGTNGTGSYVGRLKDADRSTDGGKGEQTVTYKTISDEPKLVWWVLSFGWTLPPASPGGHAHGRMGQLCLQARPCHLTSEVMTLELLE